MADPNALNPFALVVYVPPCYDVTTTQYPAIYLIHGAGVDDTHWESLGLFKVMDEGIQAGKLAPAIMVLPNGDAGLYMNTSGGSGSYAAHLSGCGRYGRVQDGRGSAAPGARKLGGGARRQDLAWRT